MAVDFRMPARALAVALLSTSLIAPVQGEPIERSDVRQFVEELSASGDFDADEVSRVLAQAETQPDIIEAISRPAEALPWHRYRPIFLKKERIELGAEFWSEHEKLLQRAQEKYGVPPALIVGILGVETRYGSYKGKHRVLDALYTLAFDYPPRSAFFRSELEQFLRLMREQEMNPTEPTGSYAGAMGYPQFISSSYRNYAVDFDDSGRTDLWAVADAIGSIANYFSRHGWRPGEPVVVPAEVEGNDWRQYLDKGLKPQVTVAQLREGGVTLPETLDGGARATLLELEGPDGPEYWVGLHNFYVITRYNHSPLYALAVYQLSEAIAERREEKQ